MASSVLRAQAELDGLNVVEAGEYKAKFETRPFASGTCQDAYRGDVIAPESKRGREVVVKLFKNDWERFKGDWSLDIRTYKKAQEMAQEFNSQSNTDRPIQFRKPALMTVTAKAHGSWTTVYMGEPVFARDFLHGTYTKWLSNNGWVNPKADGGRSLIAFAHWTWVKSGQQLLVCDLQGVRDNPRGYWLTDPAINSVNKAYGATDCGMHGINAFFRHHKCNDFCKVLNIQNAWPSSRELASGYTGHKPKMGTSYRIQVQEEVKKCAPKLLPLYI